MIVCALYVDVGPTRPSRDNGLALGNKPYFDVKSQL